MGDSGELVNQLSGQNSVPWCLGFARALTRVRALQTGFQKPLTRRRRGGARLSRQTVCWRRRCVQAGKEAGRQAGEKAGDWALVPESPRRPWGPLSSHPPMVSCPVDRPGTAAAMWPPPLAPCLRGRSF